MIDLEKFIPTIYSARALIGIRTCLNQFVLNSKTWFSLKQMKTEFYTSWNIILNPILKKINTMI